jgi:hypothetical protein
MLCGTVGADQIDLFTLCVDSHCTVTVPFTNLNAVFRRSAIGLLVAKSSLIKTTS